MAVGKEGCFGRGRGKAWQKRGAGSPRGPLRGSRGSVAQPVVLRARRRCTGELLQTRRPTDAHE
eukprot:1072362-Lingulodinium_polyedra.AAC.1